MRQLGSSFFSVSAPSPCPRKPVTSRSRSSWPPIGDASDYFGEYVAIDGDTLIVGRGNIGLGRAYVFERNRGGSNSWGEVATLLAPDVADNFGRAVEVEGDLVIVAASDVDSAGSLYFFERNAGGPSSWGLVTKLQAPGGPVAGQVLRLP